MDDIMRTLAKSTVIFATLVAFSLFAHASAAETVKLKAARTSSQNVADPPPESVVVVVREVSHANRGFRRNRGFKRHRGFRRNRGFNNRRSFGRNRGFNNRRSFGRNRGFNRNRGFRSQRGFRGNRGFTGGGFSR